eukprot:scaffold70016_cov75-Phaeocystis_antarctica.AAC.2
MIEWPSLTRLLIVARVRVPVGGDQERVEIYLLAHPDDDQTEARRLLTEQFATFNAGKAQCFLASDREHLLAVIEAGFGDFHDFNCAARNILGSRLLDDATLHSSRLSTFTGVTSRLHLLRKAALIAKVRPPAPASLDVNCVQV